MIMIRINSGDSWHTDFSFSDPSGTPAIMDITGWTGVVHIKRDGITMLELRMGQGVEVNGPLGEMQITITNEQSALLNGTYDFHLMAFDESQTQARESFDKVLVQ